MFYFNLDAMISYIHPYQLKEQCVALYNKIKSIPIESVDKNFVDKRNECIILLRKIQKVLDEGVMEKDKHDMIGRAFSKLYESNYDIKSMHGIDVYLISLKSIYTELVNSSDSSNEYLNSSEFYQKKVDDLQHKINVLENELNNSGQIDKKLNQLKFQRDQAIRDMHEIQMTLAENEKRTQEKTKEVIDLEKKNGELCNIIKSLNSNIEKLKSQEHETNKLKEELSRYEKQLQENQKREDAVSSWNSKIKSAFLSLEDYIQPIKDEHERLMNLYDTYKSLSWIILIAIFVFEILIAIKITKCGGYPILKDSIILILPIPILLGLLWGFVTQMNRAQRQMVIIAKQIHEIKYTEGLLITLNTLSVDIGESMSKINIAINRLIDNHLGVDDKFLKDEDLLKQEMQKDSMPYEKVEKIVKTILEGVKS